MRKFEIYDYELELTKVVSTDMGIVAAMYDYLPWGHIDFKITYHPENKYSVVTDNQTGFEYKIKPLSSRH